VKTFGPCAGRNIFDRVSDTSPILNLARIDRVGLLRLPYGQVLIPNAVLEELTGSKHDYGAHGCSSPSETGWDDRSG
jgi:hypothetical protein